MRFGIHLCYNGSAFAGWQRQVNAAGIQENIENGLSVLLKSETTITGCGRTDTGVHAFNYFAHFDTDINPKDLNEFVYHLNAIIDSNIHVFEVFPVIDEWNARFSATKRSYRYYILTERNPFLSQFSWMVPYSLNIDNMNEAASLLIGKHDFTSFAKLHGNQKTGICTVASAGIIQSGSLITFEISADRFLRNMVRAITGTLIDIGRGRTEKDSILELMASKNRSQAGASVPAQGLFLSEVLYENNPEIPQNKKPFF